MDADGVKLRVLLLGPPVVYYGQEQLRIQRRLLRTLLFYLAAQSEPVGRSTLIDLFWPEEDEEEGRRHLREVLSKLRTQLPNPGILLTEQDYVRLDPYQTYVDVLEYQSLIDQVRPYLQRQSTTPLPEAIYQQMYKAVNLWRSPQYLAGVNLPSTEGFDRWMTIQLQSLEYSRQSLLEALADHSANSGDLEEGVYWLRRALETDEENPDLYYRLVSWLRDLGKRSEALNVCDQARKIFETYDQGSLPPAIEVLCRQVREEASLPAPEPLAPWHNTLTLQLPFVGRKKLLADLKLALQRGGVELIWGEAGAGKSRLIFEFYQSLEPAPRLLLAAGHAHLMEMPYQPLLDLLRHTVTPEEWSQLDSVWVDHLTLLLPELLTLRPGSRRPPADYTPNLAQMTAEAFLQVFKILARRQRLLFFLDDAQWADAGTFDVLSYLLDHKLFAGYGLLVIAARPEEPNEAFDRFLSQSQVPWMVRQSQLELLGPDEIAELTRLALGKPAPEPFIQRLALDTGGNPLFLLETLRALMDINLDTHQFAQLDHLPVPSSIRALVRERLRLLDGITRQAISAAAVIGNTFFIDTFQIAAQLQPEETVQVLEAMEHAHLVRPLRTNGAGRYAFIHDKIREVILFELSQARRQFLHLRAARALESKSGEEAAYASEIARHYEGAGDLEAAFRYWLQAGEAARNRQHRSEAQAAFQRAEAILNQVERQLPEKSIYGLFSAWGEMACEAYDSDQAEYCYAAMLRHGEQRYASLLIGAAYSGLARVAGMRLHPRLALAHLEHAIPFLRESGNQYEQIEAGRRRGEHLSQLLRYQEAARTIEGVLGQVHDLADIRTRQAVADALVQLASTYLLLAEPQLARNAAQRALDTSQYYSRAISRARALSVSAMADYLTARFEESLGQCRLALQLAQDAQDNRLVCYLTSVRGNVYLYTGQLDLAWLDACAVLEQAAADHYPELLPRGYCLQGDIYRTLRDNPAAVSAYRNGLDASQDHITSMECLFRLGLALGLNNQLENGFSFLQQALELTRETGLDIVRIPAELTQAAMFLLRGQPESACEIARSVGAEVSRRGLHLFGWVTPWILAAAAVEENPTETRRLAMEIIHNGEELKAPWLIFSGLELLLKIEPERERVRIQQKIDQLMAGLSEQAGHPHIQPAFNRLLESVNIFIT